MYNTLPLHLATSLRPPHFTLYHSTSNAISGIIPNHHIPRHTIPHHIRFISHQHLSQRSSPLYHISNRTMSATLCITPLTSCIAPHFTLLTCHIMGHILCTPRHIQITPYCIQITPYCHIIYHYHISHYTTLHSISHAPHLASFHHICL